jgi:putative transposase
LVSRRRYPPEFKGNVVMELFRGEKTIAQLASEHGIHPSQLKQWRNVVLEGLPSLFTDEQRAVEKLKKEHAKENQDLYAEIGRLTTELAWLKKNLACSLSRGKRVELVDPGDPHMSIAAQARLLDLNRTGLYYKRKGPSEDEVRLKHRIDEIYTPCPFYGSIRIREVLRQEGYLVNRKAVRRHVREMGIEAIYRDPISAN